MRIIGRRWSPRVHAIKARVLFPDGSILIDPEVRDVARRLGLEIEPDSRSYDLIVVGGGQASYSAIIESYPGFPESLSGSDLARRMIDQAERFGMEILSSPTHQQHRGRRRRRRAPRVAHHSGLPRRNHRAGSGGSLFVFIGATPDTRWLERVIARDPQGFIVHSCRRQQPAR